MCWLGDGTCGSISTKEVTTRLSQCLGETDPQKVNAIADGMYTHLGKVIMEVFWFARRGTNTLDSRFTIVGVENFEKAVALDKGILVLMGHIGNWELMAYPEFLQTYEINAVVKSLRNEKVDQYWVGVRNRLGLNQLPAKNSLRACLRILRNKGLVGQILDQNMKQINGVFVDFFGLQACTSPGLAVLASHTRAPVVPLIMVRKENDCHEIQILPHVLPPEDREEEAIREKTQEYTHILEQAIRNHPEQWIWLHRRWRTQPE